MIFAPARYCQTIKPTSTAWTVMQLSKKPSQWLILKSKNQQGVTSIEYALLAAVIALAMIAGLTATGDANADFITVIKDAALKVLGARSAALGS